MTKTRYKGTERRKFVRLDFTVPLAYKVCKKKTISKLLQGYTSNISQAGLLCNIKDKVHKNDLLWLAFDRTTLAICEQLEKESFIYQNGIIGRVARIERKKNGTYDVGIQFITRKERNLTHIYPQIYFLKKQGKEFWQQPESEETEEVEEGFNAELEDRFEDVEAREQEDEEVGQEDI